MAHYITYDIAAQYMQWWGGPGEGARLPPPSPVGQNQMSTISYEGTNITIVSTLGPVQCACCKCIMLVHVLWQHRLTIKYQVLNYSVHVIDT